MAGVEKIDLSAFPAINRAKDTARTSISGLVYAPETEIPVILLTSPVGERQPGNSELIVVAVDLAQSSIGGFIRPIRLGETGYVEIVDESGFVLARTEPGPKLAPFEKSDHSGRFAALIAAGEPTRGLCHTCHEQVEKVETRDVLVFVPLSEARWGVAIRQSEEEALAPIRELRQNLLLFGAVLITVGFMFVIVTTRGVVKRIRMLTFASQSIAEGDLDSPVTSSGKDEVGILAATLDDMRVKLKGSYNELEKRTKELSSLLSISEVLTSLPDLSNLNTALSSALNKTLAIMNVHVGGILLLDEERRVLSYRAQRGLSRESTPLVTCRLGEGITGKVAQSGEAILVENISSDPRAAQPDIINARNLGAFISVPLRSKNGILGVINIASRGARKFSTEDIHLLGSIAAQISTAIENASLHQEVQQKEELRGELLREILTIQEEERKRIARELHDETSQALASLVASLETMTGMLPEDEDKVRARIKMTQDLSISILDEIHRLIYELRPSLLDDLGLVAAVRWLADNNLKTAGIKVELSTTGREKRLPSQLEAILFPVIQEAVSNITRHTKAKNAAISLYFKKNLIQVNIKDDGQGFDVEEAISSKNRPRGLGLLGMKERVELVRGTLSIRSRAGSGTQINIEIPLKHGGSDE
jgi:signal transduction histidine kinase